VHNIPLVGTVITACSYVFIISVMSLYEYLLYSVTKYCNVKLCE